MREISKNDLRPVVIYENGRITNYYGSPIATIKDGYKPSSVLKVCEGKQFLHYGKKFCFLDDFEILGEKILKQILKTKGGVLNNG